MRRGTIAAAEGSAGIGAWGARVRDRRAANDARVTNGAKGTRVTRNRGGCPGASGRSGGAEADGAKGDSHAANIAGTLPLVKPLPGARAQPRAAASPNRPASRRTASRLADEPASVGSSCSIISSTLVQNAARSGAGTTSIALSAS